MNRPIPIPKALEARGIATAAYLSRALPNVGPWADFDEREGLIGTLERPPEFGGAPTVTYQRPGHPKAKLVFGFLELRDMREERRTEREIIHGNIEERKRYVEHFPAGVSDEQTVEHEFSRTVTEAQATKKAWEAGAKASLGVEFSGVKAAAEVFGKYGEEIARQAGDSKTNRDLIRRTLKFEGPVDVELEAYRSRDRERRVVISRCDFDFKIYFQCPGGGGANVWEWSTYWTEFIPLAEGLLSDDIYGYDEFMRTPPTDEELVALTRPSDKLTQLPIEFDTVLTEHFEPI